MKTGKKPTSSPYLVPALERGLKILELLAEHPGGLLMGEMKCLALPPASLYRMLVTLMESGYILQDDSDRYFLGHKLLTLGYKALDHISLPEKASPFMRSLRDQVRETVALGVLSCGEGVVVDTVRSQEPVCVYVQIGHHFPLHTAAPAKAILAFLPEGELEKELEKMAFPRFTKNTIGSKKEFLAELETVRKSGIAYDRGEESGDLVCAAAPIFDRNSYPVASIWITGPESRLSPKKLQSAGKEVKKTAEKITLHII